MSERDIFITAGSGEVGIDLSSFDKILRPAPEDLTEAEFTRWRHSERGGCFWDGGYGYQTTLTNIRMPYAWASVFYEVVKLNPDLQEWIGTPSSQFDKQFGRESIVCKVRGEPLVAKFSIALTEEALGLASAPRGSLTPYGRDVVDRIQLMAATDSREYLEDSPENRAVKLKWFSLPSRCAQVAHQFDFYGSQERPAFEAAAGVSFPRPLSWSIVHHPSNAFAFVVLVQDLIERRGALDANLPQEEIERRRQLLLERAGDDRFDVRFDARNLVPSVDGRLYYVDHVDRGHSGVEHSLEHFLPLDELISSTGPSSLKGPE